MRFFLRMRETSEGTSYQMVRLVFRHFRNEPSPEFPLTLPCSGIFGGFFRVWLLLKPLSRSRSAAGVHVCVWVWCVGAVLCVCAVQCAVCCENQRKQREMLPSSSSLKSHTCRLMCCFVTNETTDGGNMECGSSDARTHTDS